METNMAGGRKDDIDEAFNTYFHKPMLYIAAILIALYIIDKIFS